jgi:hypothetical protein
VFTTRGEALVSLAINLRLAGEPPENCIGIDVPVTVPVGVVAVSREPERVIPVATVFPVVLVKRTVCVELAGRLFSLNVHDGPAPIMVFVRSDPDTVIAVVGAYVLVFELGSRNEIDRICTLVMSWLELNVNEVFADASKVMVGLDIFIIYWVIFFRF